MKTNKNQIEILNELFTKMNAHFFSSSLNVPLITIVRHKGAKGYFSPNSFSSKTAEGFVHEIALNPELFDKEDKVIVSTLLHECCHLWQEQFGEPGKRNYHNKEFANKMSEIGLQTYDVYTKKNVGYSVTHTIIENGKYSTFYDKNIKEDIIILKSSFVDEKTKEISFTSKTCYQCESCEIKVWGKPNLNIRCNDCMCDMEEVIK